MKIAFVTAFYYPAVDGPGQVVRELAERFVKKGNEIHVFTSDSDKYKRLKEKEIELNGVKIHRCFNFMTLVNFYTVFPSVFFRILKGKFDIVHDNISPNPSFAPLIAHMFKIPCTATVYDVPKWRKLGYSFLVSLLNTIQIKYFLSSMPYDGFAAVSVYTKKELESIVGRGKLSVIYNGANCDEMDSVKVSGKFNVPTVIYIGRFSLNKRLDWLLYATKKLIEKFRDLQVIIVGDGPDNFKNPVVKLYKELELQNNVKFMGEMTGREKIMLLKKSHVFVLPTTTEGTPLVVAEAMACKIPVIASNVGGIGEMVPYKKHLVDGADIEGFVCKIEELLKSSDLRKRLGSRGRKFVENKLNWDKISGQYEKFFKEVLKK